MTELESLISQDLLERWIDAQATLKAVKDEEMELRKDICLALQEVDQGYGTKSFNVHGFELKAVFGLNYKLDEQAYIEKAPLMSNDELECVKIKFTLDNTKFKAIESKILSDLVTVTEAAPTLKVKENGD